MVDGTTEVGRYALSFTSGDLLIRESMIAVPIFLTERDWGRVRTHLVSGNLLQTRTRSSSVRLAREVTQRLAVLAEDEVDLLNDASSAERAHLLWTAACRRYDFIGEFAEDVLRERFLLLKPTLTHEEFDSFLRGKALWHPELQLARESTLKKLRAVTFRMLKSAGFLTEAGEIVPAVLSGRLIDALSSRVPSELRFFPTAQGGAQ